MWEVDKWMREHRVTPFDLTEFDQGINDASRKDINNLLSTDRVIGLKFWSWKILRGEQLRDVCNFDVDVILRAEDEGKVRDLIGKYENREISDKQVIDAIFDLAVYIPIWV